MPVWGAIGCQPVFCQRSATLPVRTKRLPFSRTARDVTIFALAERTGEGGELS